MHQLAPPRAARVVAYVGVPPEAAFDVLEHVWEHGFMGLDADYARSHRTHVAFCASMGWLSTVRPDGQDYDRFWRLTAAGLHALEDHHNPAT